MELGIWGWIGVAGAACVVALVGALAWHRSNRDRLYAELAAKRPEIIKSQHPVFANAHDPDALRETFAKERLVRVDNVLDAKTLAAACVEGNENIPRVERSYVPTHKQGGTVSYEKIHSYAPLCLAIYHSPALIDWLSRVVGEKLVPTADHDQSSCSLLCYTQAGDHINWHFDHNFYPGRHFTVLISLRNEGQEPGGVSTSKLMHKSPDGVEHEDDTSVNSLVVFEGKEILHKATQAAEGDVRVILSMTYCTDPHISWFYEVVRRIKDTAFYGIRTLWD